MLSSTILSAGDASVLSQITSPLALMAYGAIAIFSFLGGLNAKKQHRNTRFFALLAASVFALMLAAGLTMNVIAAIIGSEERVAGNVYSKSDGLPILGALVAVAGSGEATQTKEDGSFTLTVAGSRKSHTHLIVTHDKYIEADVDLSAPGDHSVIRLKEKLPLLNITVLDSELISHPIPNAVVTVRLKGENEILRGATDQGGKVDFDVSSRPETSIYVVEAVDQFHKPSSSEGNVFSLKQVILNLEPKKTKLQVRVLDSSGASVQKATVVIRGLGSGQTGSDGIYSSVWRTDQMQATYLVEVSADGFEPRSSTIHTDSDQLLTVTLDLRLQVLATVKVNNRPLPGQQSRASSNFAIDPPKDTKKIRWIVEADSNQSNISFDVNVDVPLSLKSSGQDKKFKVTVKSGREENRFQNDDLYICEVKGAAKPFWVKVIAVR